MGDIDNVKSFFQEYEYGFTVFVVEQRFAAGRGAEYFRSFKGKENLIDTNIGIKKNITKIITQCLSYYSKLLIKNPQQNMNRLKNFISCTIDKLHNAKSILGYGLY